MRIHLILILLLTFVLPCAVSAADLSVRPILLDLELEPRESQERFVTLTNPSATTKLIVYATVNGIAVDGAGEILEFRSPVMTDRSNTVSSWIEVTRGRIEVEPGATIEVPITVAPNFNAEPGSYHAFVGFTPASKRHLAEAAALAGKADGVIVKIVVPDMRNDSMRINRFGIERFVAGGDDRTVDLEIENLGDLQSAPTGEIVFYDSRGVEIGSAPVNADEVVIPPGERRVLQAEIPFSDRLGRFKANVSLDYGVNQRANLFDTNFFFMVPPYILALLAGGFLLTLALIVVLFRRTYAGEEFDETGDEVSMYVKSGHEPNPKDHDIDLTQRND